MQRGLLLRLLLELYMLSHMEELLVEDVFIKGFHRLAGATAVDIV